MDPGGDHERIEVRRIGSGQPVMRSARSPKSFDCNEEPGVAAMNSVPQARDGSRFTVDLARPDGTYQVGPKGAERRIRGYRQALDWLRREHRAGRGAHWRRPSASSGVRGIVKAVRWVEVERSPAPSKTQSRS
jgi:hypothetical protein